MHSSFLQDCVFALVMIMHDLNCLADSFVNAALGFFHQMHGCACDRNMSSLCKCVRAHILHSHWRPSEAFVYMHVEWSGSRQLFGTLHAKAQVMIVSRFSVDGCWRNKTTCMLNNPAATIKWAAMCDHSMWCLSNVRWEHTHTCTSTHVGHLHWFMYIAKRNTQVHDVCVIHIYIANLSSFKWSNQQEGVQHAQEI